MEKRILGGTDTEERCVSGKLGFRTIAFLRISLTPFSSQKKQTEHHNLVPTLETKITVK